MKGTNTVSFPVCRKVAWQISQAVKGGITGLLSMNTNVEKQLLCSDIKTIACNGCSFAPNVAQPF